MISFKVLFCRTVSGSLRALKSSELNCYTPPCWFLESNRDERGLVDGQGRRPGSALDGSHSPSPRPPSPGQSKARHSIPPDVITHSNGHRFGFFFSLSLFSSFFFVFPIDRPRMTESRYRQRCIHRGRIQRSFMDKIFFFK